MAILTTGSLWEAAFVSRSGDQNGLNIRHYHCVTAIAPEPSDEEFAVQLNDFVSGKYAVLLANGATFWGTRVRRFAPGTPSEFVHSLVAPVPGTAIGDPLPSQVAGVIKLRTGAAGRARRGRAFIPFPAEDDSTSSGHPSASYVGRLGDLAARLITPITVVSGAGSAQMEPVLYHRATADFHPLLAADPRKKWGTQRSRGDYGRPNDPEW